ncbi:AMP-binding protein [Chitinophaga sp. G-6-1-13]|uniref:AMP-binding protein n=1 Tax=Chitinophaga fulva TaxID=2728842 RepID=A0A848GKB8_9BACT|nr:AMP-binding protein [Chitinophaga fulva]NML37849.1 AMP-binding protein [Chitinophaga fulva]
MKEESIVHALLQQAAAVPDRVVYIFPDDREGTDTRVTFSAQLQQVQTLAAQLKTHRLYGERVLLVYQEIPAFITAFLACLYCGIVPVPVYYFQRGTQLNRILPVIRDAAPQAVLCTAKSHPALLACLTACTETAGIPVIPTDTDFPIVDVLSPSLHETAFLQYTSGSTSTPKGVKISHKNLVFNQRLIKQAFGCNSASVIFSWLPFHHDMGLIGNILHAIYAGCTCVLISPATFITAPDKWLKYISVYKATHSGGPNFAYDLCAGKTDRHFVSDLDLSGWKVAFNGAEPVRQSTLEAFSERFASAGFQATSFYPCYGLAEATLLVAGARNATLPRTLYIGKELFPGGRIVLRETAAEDVTAIVSAGRIAEGMQVKIISPLTHQECGELEEGEICINGESVTSGYWNRDNHTMFHHLDGADFLRTGDLGFMFQQELFVHGRRDEMMVIRGRNIYPYDIEQAVARSIDAVENNGVALFMLPDLPDAVVVVAEIKRVTMPEQNLSALILDISNLVAGMLGIIPHDVLLVRQHGIPRTTSGKIQRVKCAIRYKDGSFEALHSLKLLYGTTGEYFIPEAVNPEQVIQSGERHLIVRYLLHLISQKVQLPARVADDPTIELTALGLDSLRATELVNTVSQQLQIHIDMSTVMQDNTLSALASIIEGKLWLKYNNIFE